MTQLLAVSRVLADVVALRVRTELGSGRDCRLLVPGLTETISRQLHSRLSEALKDLDVSVYLTARSDQQPNEAAKLVRPVGLTSLRVGSFICIASPGQLSHIQDSVRGTGGTIRGPIYSEEWPWIDSGSEHFRFRDVVLPSLVSAWSDTELEQRWLSEMILDVLVRNTQSSHRRAETLLEEMLGNFDPQRESQLPDVRARFLRHIGIACPDDNRWRPPDIVLDAQRLARGIFDRCNDDPEIRRVVSEQLPAAMYASISYFLDGVARNFNAGATPLALHACWNSEAAWTYLSSRKLRELFSLDHKAPDARITLESKASLEKGVTEGREIVTFGDSTFVIKVTYSIPASMIGTNKWKLRVSYRTQIINEHPITRGSDTVDLPIQLSNFSYRQKRSTLVKRIPIRLDLVVGDDRIKSHRYGLHLCCDDRPSIIVVSSADSVDLVADAKHIEADKEVTPESVRVDRVASIHLLANSDDPMCEVTDEDGAKCVLLETDYPGVLKLKELIDPSSCAGGVATRLCKFDSGSSRADILIEAGSSVRGEFTLENELISLLSSSGASRERDIIRLYRIFGGKDRRGYSRLGGISERARYRNVIADIMTRNADGWRPILMDIFESGAASFEQLGQYVRRTGNAHEATFSALQLSGRPSELLDDYSSARSDLIAFLDQLLDESGRGEHPTYACVPMYVDDVANEIEGKINLYLDAYIRVLQFLDKERETLEWAQLFVITHLDCVVHWDDCDDSIIRHQIFLIGPWHPLVVASRFMVQNAVFLRARRLVEEQDHSFRFLASLLCGINGFRWLPGVVADDRDLVPALVTNTSDPGWRIAMTRYVYSERDRPGIEEIIRSLRLNLDLVAEYVLTSSSSLHTASLIGFQRAFPSRRSLGICVRGGTSNSDVVSTVSRYLHGDDSQEVGELLPGGVRLYFDNDPGDEFDAKWTDPPLEIYLLPTNDTERDHVNFDLEILSNEQVTAFKPDVPKHRLPRGLGRQYVFSRGLNWLTEGSRFIPTSVAYEYDCPESVSAGGLAERMNSVMYHLNEILDGPIATVRRASLPNRLSAPWVVLPGNSIDPAVLVQYVRDGIKRRIEERALWDYRVDVSGGSDSSYFVLSTIPHQFIVAVSNFFGVSGSAGQLLTDLGSCGIAIGGESLRSGRHALGVIGLVAAVKLFLSDSGDGTRVISNSEDSCGFLLPIDSFASLFGRGGTGDESRGDLLAIHIRFTGDDRAQRAMELSASGIEAKFVSGTFETPRAIRALRQASNSVQKFRSLVDKSLATGGMPERLALLDILSFGLRISSPDDVSRRGEWVGSEIDVYGAVLSGRYRYRHARFESVLVSTEGGLEGVPECKEVVRGLWVRLTRRHWPGIAESTQLQAIRHRLAGLFGQVTQVSNSSLTAISGEGRLSSGLSEPGGTVVAGDSGGSCSGRMEVDQKDLALPVRPRGVDSGARSILVRKFMIGVDQVRSPVYFDPHSTSRSLENVNVMITGSSGMGKTQFLKYMICQIREQQNSVLILDMKNDFASDEVFCARNRLLRAFVAFDGLPINPLIPYPIPHPATGKLFVQCSQHISGIAYLLKQTYGLGVQQEASIKRAIVDSFLEYGVDTSGSVEFSSDMQFPDFAAVGVKLRDYNLSAYNRLDPLFTLDLFRPEHRSSALSNLFSDAVVLDFSQIPSDDLKNALAQMLIMSANAYLNALPHTGAVRQFVVVDEAHRVLDSQHLTSLVRQCRSYGISTVLSSQYPSDFPRDTSDSMATKVLFGNGPSSDRVRDISALLGFRNGQDEIASLQRFEAIIANRHYGNVLMRTMNYPLYLVMEMLDRRGEVRVDDVSSVDGLDVYRLSGTDLISQLELMGLCERRGNSVVRK